MGHRTKLFLSSFLVITVVTLLVATVSIGTLYSQLFYSQSLPQHSQSLHQPTSALAVTLLLAAVATILMSLAGALVLVRVATRLLDRREPAENALGDELEQNVEERTAELKASIGALRTSEEQVRMLLDSTAEAIYGIDMRGHCTFANPACVRMLGYNSDVDLLGRNMHVLMHHTRGDGSAYPVHECRIFEAFQRDEGTHVDDEVLWRADGTSFPAEYWSYPIQQHGRTAGSVVTFLDITERRQAEAALRNARDFADTVINSLPGVFYVFDMDGGFLRWNKNTETITGYSATELETMVPLDFFHEQDHAMITERIEEVFEKGISTTRADYQFKNGSSAPFLFTGLRFESDGRQLLIGFGVDISEQQEAETKLRQHAKRLRVIGDIMEAVLEARSTAQIAAAVLDRLEGLVPCSRSSVVLFDGQLESAVLLAAHRAPDTSMKPGTKLPLEMFGGVEQLLQGKPYRIKDLGNMTRSVPQQRLFDEGVRAYVSVPLRVEGDLVGTLNVAACEPDLFSEEHVMVAQEVAKPLALGIRQSQLHAQVLEHAERLESRVEERTSELVEAEARFRMVVEATPNALIMSDSRGIIQLANAQAETLFGYPRQELVGQPVEMLVPENRRASHPEYRLEYLANPEARSMGAGRDLSAQRKDGREVPVEIGLNPLTIDGQTLVLASIVDITERTIAEVALRESEGRFRELFENANDLIQAVAPDGKFVYVNPAWCRTLDRQPDEIESLTIFNVIHPESLEHCANLFQRVIAGEDVGTIEATFKAKDGTRIMVEGHASCQHDDDGNPIVTRSIFRDVTQRKATERTLRDAAVIGKLRYDIHGALAHRGSLQEVLQDCAQAVVDHLGAAFARIWTLNEQESLLELQASAGLYTHLDGPHGRIPVGQFKIGLIAAERQPHLTNSVIEDARISDQEWARREGMVAFAGYPLIADDRMIGVLAMFARHEITETTLQALESIGQGVALGIERVRAEDGLHLALYDLAARTRQLEVAKEQAEAADRVKSAFLATMSHELRTPLNSIIGFTGIMSKGLTGPLNEEQQKQLGMVQGSARHLLSLINDVLDISKIEAGQFEMETKPYDFGAAVDRVVKTVTLAAEQKQLKLRCQVAPDIGTVVGDERRVEQVLLNLINNSIKFTDVGEVSISCSLQNDMIVTQVSDTGLGIKSEDISKLFTAFQQLDSGLARQHDGTGLGLAICKRLVNLMGGEITVESTWNEGSTFSFTLPRKSASDDSTEPV